MAANTEKMFDAFKQHLQITRDLKLINRTDDYICPICLSGFGREDLDKLSLEDAPQYQLGGKKIALTCKNCNNTCGNTIDFHLVNYINICENKRFLVGSDRKIKLTDLGQGKSIDGFLKINNNEKELRINKNLFNSPILKERLNMLVDGKVISWQDKPLKCDLRYVAAAVIKSAYIILFSKTGYTFLLDEYYDRIRSFIINPESITNPKSMWTIISNNSCSDGIYLSNNIKCRGFYVVYTVSRIQSYKIITYIPSPLIKFEDAIDSFYNLRLERNGLSLQKFDNQNLLWNEEKITMLRKWAYSVE